MFLRSLFALTTLVIGTDATYSIVGTDASTGRVGGAGASCVPCSEMSLFVYLSSPGHAVMHSQAMPHAPISKIKRQARQMMEEVSDLDQILANLEEMDENYETRQYGIANFTASTGNTGNLVGGDSGYPNTTESDIGGSVTTSNNDTIIYHAQANTVTNGTLELMVQGFEDSDSDDLAEKFMAALVSIVGGNGGDKRCLDYYGTSAATGFIRVENSDRSNYIDISVVGNGEFEVSVCFKKSSKITYTNNFHMVSIHITKFG